MNSLERVQAVISGKTPDRIPVCLHNFMMAAREAGIPMERYRVDPNAIAQTHLQAWEKYGHDCLLIDTDTTLLAEAMGAQAECAPDEPGRIVRPAIREPCGGRPAEGRQPGVSRPHPRAARSSAPAGAPGGQRGSDPRQRGPDGFRPCLHVARHGRVPDGTRVRAREPGHPRASRDLFREPPRRASRLDQSGRSPDLAGRQPCRPRTSFPPKRSTGLPGRTRHAS